MKLLKLKLQNWRGVESRDIEFSAGVTLIEGPNEIGKSTIIEAIQKLFTVMDSSGRADIKAIQPAGKDVGSTVEVEVEAGDYHFVYTKTYNRNRQTELRLLAPQQQQLTGREAHEYVEQILEESVDMALWNALLVEQGGEIAGVSLAKSDGLARALDEIAGGDPSQQDDGDLIGRVQAHYEQYFSLKTGKAKAWQSALEERLEEAVAAEAAAAAAMQELEQDIANHERTREEIARLEGELPSLQKEMEEHAARWQTIAKVKEQLQAREQESASAQELLKSALDEQNRRARLIDDLASSRAKQKTLGAALIPQAQALKSLERATADAKAALDQARAELSSSNVMAALRRNDVDHLLAVARRDELHDRLNKLQEYIDSRNSLRESLQQVRINPGALKKLREAQREVEMAAARLETVTSTVNIQAESDLEMMVNEEHLQLPAGDTQQRQIASATKMLLPGVVTIEVIPSQSAGDLEAELNERQALLTGLLQQNLVSDLAEAVAVEERRAANERELTLWNDKIDDLLRGETLESLQHALTALTDGTQAYLDERLADAELPSSVDEARELASAVADAHARHQERFETLRNAWEASRDSFTEARGHYRVAEQESAGEKRIADQYEQDLQAARDEQDDAQIADRVQEKRATLASVQQTLAELRADLESSSPEAAEQLFENSRAVCQRAQNQLAEHRTHLAVLADRLTHARADGRYEALEEATGNRLALAEELEVMSARAAAAQRLWQVLNHHRDAARSAYVRPLKEHVEQFGRIVFGADFAIELGDDWELRARTLHGQTIPFDDLSIGAKEQLGILLRLAAARIVSSQGGVPLIIDDALGFSDPDRLKTMAAAIASAGKDCQVIVLTCSPGRFTHVGNATVVSL